MLTGNRADTLPRPTGPAHDGTLSGNDAFIEDVREFLRVGLTPDLRQAGQQTTGVHSPIDACRIWHRRLYDRGWIAPSWPREYGGTGWSVARRFLFEQECARHDAPILFATGMRSIGPTIIALGSEEQKRRYLQPILTGEDLWCQGFSEAGAGSDLAALTTRATPDNEFYVVTGRKLWTTGADIANRMFALVRTQVGNKPQEGITFLLIDMATPGIVVKPIISLDGQHEFNEVEFNAACIPRANRLGAENDGWSVAKHLMRFARTNNTNSSVLRRAWRALERSLAAQSCDMEAGLRARLTQTEIDLVTFESLEMRLLAAGRLSGDDEAGSSLMKVTATELHQQIATLLLELAGPYGAASPALELCGGNVTNQGTFAVRKYLATRAASIYSGTNEIHRNVLGKHLVAFDRSPSGTR